MTALADFIGFNLEPWTNGAVCRDADPDTFFPHPTDVIGVKNAKRICVGCPVRNECARHAFVFDERFGIWGGLTERERRSLIRQGRPPTIRPTCGTDYGIEVHYRAREQACLPCREAAAARRRRWRDNQPGRGGA
jgi:hypothetical protein